MELFDEFAGVRNVFDRLPSLGLGSSFVSGPSNEVMEFSANVLRVQNGYDFVFGVSIDFDRRWGRLVSIRNRILAMKRE